MTKKKIVILLMIAAGAFYAHKSGAGSSFLQKITTVSDAIKPVLAPYNILETARRNVEAYNRKQRCLKLYLDEIGDTGPESARKSRHAAIHNDCQGIITL